MAEETDKVRLEPYLYFNGNAKEAIDYYVKLFNAEIKYLGKYCETPMTVPDHWKEKVFHASIAFNGVMIVFSDVEDSSKPVQFGQNSQLSIYWNSLEKASSVFDRLKEEGAVITPLERQFWGAYNGSVKDKFGVIWIFSYRPTESV
jgi:PhnB protein